MTVSEERGCRNPTRYSIMGTLSCLSVKWIFSSSRFRFTSRRVRDEAGELVEVPEFDELLSLRSSVVCVALIPIH